MDNRVARLVTLAEYNFFYYFSWTPLKVFYEKDFTTSDCDYYYSPA
jgi:hypothetical protein